MKVTAVIPCYNEERTIADIVRRAKQYCDRVIVVDNMSTDNTIEEAEKETQCYNISLCFTKGAGAATREGLIQSLNPVLRGDIIVALDGDGQHNPDEIPKVVAPIIEDRADMVLGSRFLNSKTKDMPRYREFGIGVINWLYNIGNSHRFTDTQCCMRAFSRKALEVISITESGFAFSIEMLAKAQKAGLRIAEVPVEVIYHKEYSQNSTSNPITHGIKIILGILKWRLKCRV